MLNIFFKKKHSFVVIYYSKSKSICYNKIQKGEWQSTYDNYSGGF